jgi:aspartate/methionine/tyrosine aminotransferase
LLDAMFSDRTGFAEGTNALAAARDRRRASGLPLLDLADSNPANAGFAWPAAEVAAALAGEGLARQDPDPRGMPSARAAVAGYYAGRGVKVDTARVFMCASTSEGYAWIFKLLCSPGDEVLVPEPSYPLLEVIAALECVRLRTYRLRPEGDGWTVDAASLSAGPRTRAIVCVNPSNPVGAFVGAGDRTLLRRFAREHGIAVLCDEVFLDYAAGAGAATWAGETEAPIFVLSGLSKVALAPQVKAGWVVVGGPGAFADAACARLEHVADAFLSVSTPAQLALPRLLSGAHPLREAVVRRCAESESALRKWAEANGCSVLPRQGGWTGVLRLPAGVEEERLLLAAVDEGVWAHPGYFYGLPTELPCCVVSLLTPSETLRDGLESLGKALRRS